VDIHEIALPALHAPVAIHRDGWGIAHVRATDEHDAWVGMGFACAQDRLWQMEYDRRRATGRSAEVVGRAALAADVLARRLGLAGAAQADLAAMSDPTRDAFSAYAAGVNAFIDKATTSWPPELTLAGIEPEPWEPWHSVAVFKVRHVLMGTWQRKLADALVVARAGPEAVARAGLQTAPPPGSVVTLPPGGRLREAPGRFSRRGTGGSSRGAGEDSPAGEAPLAGGLAELLEAAREEVEGAAPHLGFLAEVESGSNAWALHGSCTLSESPVLCNDSHRALDVPNVYWPIHVSCPAFDVIGATFPGLPGWPHFGHNASVAWAITHAYADYQDLYVEWFDTEHPGRYRTSQGWAEAGHRREVIGVRGEDAVPIEVWTTNHGPVVHGNPAGGRCLSLRYTATARPCQGFEVLRPMLAARSVQELFESQRAWVDPANNMLAADTAGHIGYLMRGEIPVRSKGWSGRFPVPGWTGQGEWEGAVPFEELPRSLDPPEGFLVTANHTVVDAERPYIATVFSDPWRAERLVELLAGDGPFSASQLAALQADTTSLAARAWAQVLAGVGPLEGDAERARSLLAGFDGDLGAGRPEPLLYACFRRAVARRRYGRALGGELWEWLASDELPGTDALVRRWLTNDLWALARASGGTRGARLLREALPRALADAWGEAAKRGGDDPAGWRWDDHHRLVGRHPLAPGAPAEWDPPPVPMGGDGDTVQAAAYGWGPGPFDVTGCSVYRQVVDLADIDHASFVVPGGASGNPSSPHFCDQLAEWAAHRRVPALYRWDEIEAATSSVTRLQASPA
jgi:penicillin amidase